MKTIFVFCLVMLLISACLSLQQVSTPTPYPTRTETPSPAPTRAIAIISTPTEIQLPYNLVQESSEYCQSPYAALSIGDAERLSEDEIARKLIGVWLDRYKNPEAHLYCRIDDYRVDDVYYDPRAISLPLEPKGDFMRAVKFSIKLIQVPNDWMAFSGEVDEENWLHIGHYISISKIEDNYVMVFAYP